MDILILRDPRESKRKCSLTPLEGLEGVEFQAYDPDRRISADGRILLDPEGEDFGPADHGAPLFLIDCAWRRVPNLLRTVDGDLRRRRLPLLKTAYPRVSRIFEDPLRGLASIEALYAACLLVGEERPELLEAYHWRQAFLTDNAELLDQLRAGRRARG